MTHATVNRCCACDVKEHHMPVRIRLLTLILGIDSMIRYSAHSHQVPILNLIQETERRKSPLGRPVGSPEPETARTSRFFADVGDYAGIAIPTTTPVASKDFCWISRAFPVSAFASVRDSRRHEFSLRPTRLLPKILGDSGLTTLKFP